MIRNAGGRASGDAIRSLMVSLHAARHPEWFVIHHTDCGMQLFTDSIIRNLLRQSLKTASVNAKSEWEDSKAGDGSGAGDFIPFLPFRDNAASVLEDVERICRHPRVPAAFTIYGYIYDVSNGKLLEVPEATRAGRAV